jgi:hypothetical protein
VRQQADRARKATVFAGFIAAVSLLISRVVACAAVDMGVRHRDEARSPTSSAVNDSGNATLSALG